MKKFALEVEKAGCVRVVNESKTIVLEKKGLVLNAHEPLAQKKETAFNEKHSDEKMLDHLTPSNEAHYTKSSIDDSKDFILGRFSVFKTILTSKNILSRPIFIAKDIALSHSDEVKENGEDRGTYFQKSSQMYEDAYRLNPDFFKASNLTAQRYSDLINVRPRPYIPSVVLHSKLTQPNAYSYKHSHEVVVAKQISAETGTEIFVTGDCNKDDPELVSWIGDLKIKNYESSTKGQSNVDFYQKVKTENGLVVVKGDLKMRSAPSVLNNDQLGKNDHSYDTYYSIGTVFQENREKIAKTIATNALKLKEKEYFEATKNPAFCPKKLAKLRNDIDLLRKYKFSNDNKDLHSVENVYKVVTSSKKLTVKVQEEDKDDISSNLVD